MAVNLRDCPPFASLATSNLPAADRARFEELYAAAGAFEAEADFAAAARCWEQAARLDPQLPELQFRWAECLARMTN